MGRGDAGACPHVEENCRTHPSRRGERVDKEI